MEYILTKEYARELIEGYQKTRSEIDPESLSFGESNMYLSGKIELLLKLIHRQTMGLIIPDNQLNDPSSDQEPVDQNLNQSKLTPPNASAPTTTR